MKPSGLALDAEFSGDDEPRPSGWGIQRRPFVRFDSETGAFEVSCDTPRKELVVRVFPRGHEELAKRFVFYPEADRTEGGVEILFP